MNLFVAGDLDLNPEGGQYRLTADVPGVEVNQLRATLGVRPTPQPVAGCLAGVLHVTGPLEKPVFSGSAWAVRPEAQQLGDCEPTDALAALAGEPGAVGAWDRLPLRNAGAVFSLDTAREVLELHSAHADLVDGGQVGPFLATAWALEGQRGLDAQNAAVGGARIKCSDIGSTCLLEAACVVPSLKLCGADTLA